VTRRRFFVLLGLITLLGFAVRLAYLLIVKWDQSIWGDAFTYHYTANGIADGLGFQSWVPDVYTPVTRGVPTVLGLHAHANGVAAENPPLFPLYLSAFSFVGLRSFHAHMVAQTLLGVASVFVMGLVGRKVWSPRVGLWAALIAAVYANFWVYDPLVISESMGILAGALMVLMAYRAWDKPTLKNMVWLGITFGLASLVRSEFVLLTPFIVIPLVIRAMPGRAVKDRVGYMVAAGAVAFLVVSPWVIRNLTTFDNPTFLSHDAGLSLASGSCDATYYGPALGWWSPQCVIHKHPPKGDPSVKDAFWSDEASDYINDHLDRVPVVALARLGRMWEVFHPGTPWGDIKSGQTLGYVIVEGRSEMAARLALGQFWLIVPLSIAGFVLLWRRKRPIWPLLALPVLVSIVAVYAFGNLRYRSIAEVALVATAAVTMDALVTRFWPKRASADPDAASSDSGGSDGGPPGGGQPEPDAPSAGPAGGADEPELQPVS
jgi:hypothetical protein